MASVVFPVEDILHYWFGDSLNQPEALEQQARWWFRASSETDREVQQRFGEWLKPVAEMEALSFSTPMSLLAGVLVTDQFARHIFRYQPQAFAFDGKALALLDYALEQGWESQLHPLECSFLYMPLQHAEDMARQEQGVKLFGELVERSQQPYQAFIKTNLDYAKRHRDLIRQFGRFPHRNRALGRSSTPEEVAYLENSGQRFGQ